MFGNLKTQVLDKFNAMVATGLPLFIAKVNKDLMWDTYLNSFEDEEEKQHHNCNCCRIFIKNYGGLVIIDGLKLVTIWDFLSSEEIYVPAVDALGNLVRNSQIENLFKNDFLSLGTSKNYDIEQERYWEHFHVEAPSAVKVKKQDKETILSDLRATKQVCKRGLDELTIESTEIVLDLIAQDSLYRGKEFKGSVESFLDIQKVYKDIPVDKKDIYIWSLIGKLGNSPVLTIRNTAMGTLLINLSQDMELDTAVRAWEKVMAPTNYKRPTALVSKGQVEDAEKKVDELGIRDSLGRRFATPDDISVDNVIFVNRDAKRALGIFEELKEETSVSPRSFNKLAEISIDKFIEEVLPTATGVEVLVENNHLSNLVSLIAPQEPEAPNLFKWDNPFSWSYINALTDSAIKEKVKAAGGNVNGVIRVSLSWFNYDDLDLHVIEPSGREIMFNNCRTPQISPTTGQLDVDMNANCRQTRQGVENITWTDADKMESGVYKVYVKQFEHREAQDYGCIVEIECNGELFTFERPEKMQDKTLICEFNYTKDKGISFAEGQSSSVISKEKWGINTNRFQKVSMIMNSPNYWKNQIGNKHVIFAIEGAKNDETPRGFFNEFLTDDLTKNRKVFEILGARLKVEPSDRQVTGLGFSSTQRNSIICRVDGTFKRTLKVTF